MPNANLHIYKYYSGYWIYTRQKRNATRRTNRPSERSQATEHFLLYRLKGMSVTAAFHIFRNQGSKIRESKLAITQVGVKL